MRQTAQRKNGLGWGKEEMKELHLTKKDFKIEWFSGSGAGGQHRNKHQNCCRIIHAESGLSAIGTSFKERSKNQQSAFKALAKKIIAQFMKDSSVDFKINTEIIRNYNESRNEVHDKASGLKMPYNIVMKNGIGPMIEARKDAINKGARCEK